MRVGGDLVGVAEPVEQRPQAGLVIGAELGPGHRDVLGDLLDDLAALCARQVGKGIVEAVEVVVDKPLPRRVHAAAFLSMKWSTAPRNRCHSTANASSAARPAAVSR